jgi:hypothetical protein
MNLVVTLAVVGILGAFTTVAMLAIFIHAHRRYIPLENRVQWMIAASFAFLISQPPILIASYWLVSTHKPLEYVIVPLITGVLLHVLLSSVVGEKIKIHPRHYRG